MLAKFQFSKFIWRSLIRDMRIFKVEKGEKPRFAHSQFALMSWKFGHVTQHAIIFSDLFQLWTVTRFRPPSFLANRDLKEFQKKNWLFSFLSLLPAYFRNNLNAFSQFLGFWNEDFTHPHSPLLAVTGG